MNGIREVWSIRHELAPLLDARAWGAGLGVLGAAFFLGALVLPRLRRRRFSDTQLMRLLAGVVLLGPLTLLVGQIPGGLGYGRAGFWFIPAIMGWILIVYLYLRARARARQRSTSRQLPPEGGTPELAPEHSASGLVGWLVLSLCLGWRLLPAFCPPLAYDTLEYHQGIIPHVFQEGRYRPIPRIFYTAQPQSAEALYTLAAVMEGTPWGFAPGLAHWLLIVLATAAAARALGGLGIASAWRPWLLLIFLEHPLILRLQMDRMSDWFGVLMLASGVWVGLEWTKWTRWTQWTGRQAGPAVLPVLLGLFIGGAAGSKWTHVGTVAVPLLLLAAGFRPAMLKGTLLAALVGLCVWLPWGAWLQAVRGNPFAPFLAGVFPSREWGPANLAFLLQAHDPLRPIEARYWLNLLRRLTVDFPGPPLIALGAASVLALLLLRVRATRGSGALVPVGLHGFALRLGGGLAIALLSWGTLAQAADRFLGPVMLGATFLVALALRGMMNLLARRLSPGAARRAGLILLLAFAAVNLNNIYLNLASYGGSGLIGAMAAHAAGRMDRYDYVHWWYHDEVRVIRAANALPAGSRLLALNDARRYLYTGRIDTASVFDENPVREVLRGTADAEALRRRLVEKGYTHVLYNGFEQVRILKMQTPPALRNDPEFAAVLKRSAAPGAPEAEAARVRWMADQALAQLFRGYTESPVDPLTPGERKVYGVFLDALKARATAIIPPRNEADAPLAFWIAPLL